VSSREEREDSKAVAPFLSFSVFYACFGIGH
jgi:hypothetical protein